MCKNPLEGNKTKYKNIKNRTKKMVANSMKKEAEEELTKLNKKPNNIFTLVKFIKSDGKDIEEGRCMKRKDRRLDFSKKDKKRIWKNYMKDITNKEKDWNHVTAVSMVKGPIKNVTRKKMPIAIKVMKLGKAAWIFWSMCRDDIC